MHTDDLAYDLPEQLIAQHPAPKRGDSQLLVVRAGADGPENAGRFADTLIAQLRPDDLVVANDSRVLRARLRVTRPGGGVNELLLLEPAEGAHREGRSLWRVMARPSRRMREGMPLLVCQGMASIRCEHRLPNGTWVVDLPVAEEDVPDWLEQNGELPLPPYIEASGQDSARYQTVYADAYGSVAAPTAGLHFSDELWARVGEHCEVATITLHVGTGTFLPVREGLLDAHEMHAERYGIPPAADASIRTALAAGRRVVAVGTTSTRVLESVYGPASKPVNGTTDLFITPGYEFGCVGAMLTNFHLPKSTLLALVMAFAGVETTRAAYREAIARELRFFSFGDAMFVHGAQVPARG